ncbi:MAG: hypothetical protein PUP93_23160 [Rhizonema sp. NSF051]|nr:hypothetical protein [Rhizonema sp. NSF051]
MPPRHYPPAQLRYLKARLSNLTRPSFWGTAIFLSILGLAIEQYWTHPTFLTQEQKEVPSKNSTDSSLSAEDKTIAADIDNLPVLYNTQTISSTASSPGKNIQVDKSQALSNDSAIQSQTSVSDAKSNPTPETVNPIVKLENPFLAQAENLLQFNNAQTVPSYVTPKTVPTPQNTGIGLTQTNSTSNVAQVSSSQTPVNPLINQNWSDFNNTTLTQTNSLGRSQPTSSFNSGAIAPIPTGTSLPQPSITNISPYSSGTSYTQTPVTNQQPSAIYGTGYAQPILTNQNLDPRHDLNRVAADPRYQDFVNQVRQKSANLNGTQVLPNVGTATTFLTPINPTSPTYGSPYYSPSPIYNSSTPAITGIYGNPNLQQSTQVPQYNLSSPNQIPQYTGGNQISGYSYP